MLRMLIPSLCGLALSGCATILGPTAAPSCDGYSRRPLNPSMWNFEEATLAPLPAPPSEVDVPVIGTRPEPKLRTGQAKSLPLPGNPPGRFDVAASVRSCTSERGHG